MTDVHQCSKVDFLFVSLSFQNSVAFALYLVQLPGWICLELLPFLVHCCFRIQNFHRLGHRNKLVHQMLMSHRIVSFACDVSFMIFLQR